MAGVLDGDDIQALEDAILQVCPTHDRLRMFVVKRIHFDITPINDRDDVDVAIFKLIDDARKDTEKIKKLLTGLKGYRPVADQSRIQELCDKLLSKLQPPPPSSPPLVEPSQSHTLDFDSLFQDFENADLQYVRYAFHEAFEIAYNRTFYQMSPTYAGTNSLDGIQDLLVRYGTDEENGPILAVRFVELAIAELRGVQERTQRPDARAFFRSLEDWRHRTAKAFNIQSSPLQSASPKRRQGYLLITFQVPTEGVADGNVSAELYLGEAVPYARPKDPQQRCKSLDDVSQRLSEWIYSAKLKLGERGCSQVCIELFLPHQLIEAGMDAADAWQVQAENYVFRALERVTGSEQVPIQERVPIQFIHSCLQANWGELEQRKHQPACNHFHIQDTCPAKGNLKTLTATGLSLTAELTTKPDERQGILLDVVNSGVPIAVWYGPKNQQTPKERLAALSRSLERIRLTDFGQLAQVWRNLRTQDNVRLLVDCPYRLPELPDPKNREPEDALLSETLRPPA